MSFSVHAKTFSLFHRKQFTLFMEPSWCPSCPVHAVLFVSIIDIGVTILHESLQPKLPNISGAVSPYVQTYLQHMVLNQCSILAEFI